MAKRFTPSEPPAAVLPDGARFVVRDVSVDEHGIRVAYTIHPMLPATRPGERRALQWNFLAVDDRQNRYEDGGGAYGADPDCTRTVGVLTLRPRPPNDARMLTVKISPSDDPELQTRPWLEFDVALPRTPAP